MAAPSKKKSHNRKSKDGPKFNKASKKPFKANKKDSDDGVKAQAMALQLEEDVPDFPRGGGSSLSQKDRDDILAEVDAEFEAEERILKKMKKKGKKPQNMNHSREEDFGSLFSDGLTGKLPRFANKITLKNISPGMKLWGVITEINEKDLVISLPGGLRGLVRSKDALDPILDNEIEENGDRLPIIFCIGQLVSCIVLQLEDDKKDNGKRKIWLSLRLSLLHKGFSIDTVQEGMVLTAYVKSIEDHGYMLHFGSHSFVGFLPKISRAEGGDAEVKPGQLLQAVVTRIDKTRKVVYLSSDPDSVSKSVVKDLKGISIDLLFPGMMVNVRVQSTLENGVMLSFLTYFTGTVDIFHLQNTFPTSNWRDDYPKNRKVNARILFIDPSTRAIGLTLNQHLVQNNAPPLICNAHLRAIVSDAVLINSLPSRLTASWLTSVWPEMQHLKVGDIYDSAKVVRVDGHSGLLLEIPSVPVSIPAYVSVSDVAEDEVRKLEKKFKEGSRVRVRILGSRHLEGLATGILKASAFEGPVFTHSDVKPGMIVRAKIMAVDNFGAIVQFPGGLKALCPLQHMSEFEIVKPRKKFKVGAELPFRVLGCKSKRITVTQKKTLVKSGLPILSSYADATEGLITHGWMTKIEKHGCFVHFYNGVQGFVPRSELGLEPGSDASLFYHVGQVVKCRVMSSFPASHRIRLSFVMKRSRDSEEDVVKLGSVIRGVVEKLTPHAVIVYVNVKGYWKGTITAEHLADHHEHTSLMLSLLKPGYEFDQLLVLDMESNNLVLSAKQSLINSAQELPPDLSQICPQSVVPGYICNIIETGCFVRFLGHLTGFCPRSKAMDDQRTRLSEAFYVGQSVRSNILDVNSETSRITLSLKQSCCSSTDASFLQEYFLSEEKIAKLQHSDTKGTALKWAEEFSLGSTIVGVIQELNKFGAVVSFEKYNDIFGFITHFQLGGTSVEIGSAIRAVVLDVAKTENLVDLSLKPDILNKAHNDNLKAHRKKRKREASDGLEVLQTVDATVEIVKDNYLVLSIPKHNYAIGYASISDYNTQKFPLKQFLSGQSVSATVMALPSPSTSGRLLLLLKSISEVTGDSSSKKARKKSSYNVGSLVQAEITEVKPLEMRLKFGIGFRGRIHITEINDFALENPFGSFKIGQTISARIMAKPAQSDNKKSKIWELSIRPKILEDSGEQGDEKLQFSVGQCVTGYVYKVDSEWAWLTVSRHIKAQLFISDSSCEPLELQEFQKHFYVGKAVVGYVLSYRKDKTLLRLVLRPPRASIGQNGSEVLSGNTKEDIVPNDIDIAHISEGDIVGGRISKVLPGVGGLLVKIGPNMYGRVHFTEIHDLWVPDPLHQYSEGEFVKCKILEISRSVKGNYQIDLSFRLSLDGMLTHNLVDLSDDVGNSSRRADKIEDLHPNMVVQGYVKNVTAKGCFILLSRKLDAKILLCNLSDGYIDDPEKEFPIGKLVVGKVLSAEPLSKRVEVTLKLSGSSTTKSDTSDLSHLSVGSIISGKIKRVESYGLFIEIDHTNLVGLCHVSQLSDDHVDKIESKYRAGEIVTAKILKIDERRHRISLGMKDIHSIDDVGTLPSRGESDEAFTEDDRSDTWSMKFPESNLLDCNLNIECENEECPLLAQAELRALIPPLEVNLDDFCQSHVEDVHSQIQQHADEADTGDEKNKRQARKKAKEQREQEIRAAEERLLEKDIPRTADEYEKLVRSSPNSSFVWIKYMAFMLSLADVEKARSIAQRALRTINVREENEKLNVWVAYFNLENQYGIPPEEAVRKIFQRALQYCDPKKVHLALLGMYERTEQQKLADELLQKIVKKFKRSCKVWLRWVQRLLKQGQDGLQSVVQRAILSLPRHKHIKFLSQTAILEFKCGLPDRGRSMFEGILREYPKRTDLWSVYLDQEIKLGDVDVIRALFERAVSLSLPPKKMKFLFKKYLEYEKSLGEEERIDAVKQKAIEYVENTLA